MYTLQIQAVDKLVSVQVAENTTEDVPGNLNLASDRLEVRHYSVPASSSSIAIITTVLFAATAIVATLLTVSTSSLLASGAISRPPSYMISKPSRNLLRLACHIQIFALSRWLSINLPIEYYEFTKGIEWTIPYIHLPWEGPSADPFVGYSTMPAIAYSELLDRSAVGADISYPRAQGQQVPMQIPIGEKPVIPMRVPLDGLPLTAMEAEEKDHYTLLAMALSRPYLAALLVLCACAMALLPAVVAANVPITTCRSFCGNITVDYPFALRPGCGHAGFRDLLYCINAALMLHLPSGSYRVLDIDYAYRGLTLHDPAMSDCRALDRSPVGRGNGFVVEPWRAPFLAPDPDNVFLLLGCRASSPLFQGFPDRHLPCRNVSGMGCGEYYGCPAWDDYGRRPSGAAYGTAVPPECCAVSWDAIRAVNVSRLECEGYSSAYSLAPVRAAGPGGWAYGIRVAWALPEANRGFCGACRATGGVCGHDGDSHADLCLCGDWNSTSNCDSSADAARSSAAAPRAAIAALRWAVLASGFSFPWWYASVAA